MRLFIIIETDFNDKETSVLGVADSLEKAKEMVDEYYGPKKKLLSEYTYNEEVWALHQTFEVLGAFDYPYKVRVDTEEFYLNQL